MTTELHCIGLINKIDDVAKNESVEYYHRIIIIKQLIEDYRQKGWNWWIRWTLAKKHSRKEIHLSAKNASSMNEKAINIIVCSGITN